MDHKTKVVMFSLIPAAITSVLLAVGGLAGYYVAIRSFRSQIQANSANETLGQLMNAEKRAATARAYHDGPGIADDMKTFSWVPPNLPTPFVGHGLRPGRSGNASVNSSQLRAGKEVVMPKPVNVYRIFLTGGSTAFSSGAPSEDRTIAGYLAAFLNAELSPRSGLKYEVFTAANPAWASTHERIMIENRLSEMQPDLVVSLSGNNDVFWGMKGRDVLWFRAFADEFFFKLLDTAHRVSGFGPLADPLGVPSQRVSAMEVGRCLEKNVRLSSSALSFSGVRYVFFLQPTLSVTGKSLSARERLIHPPSKDYFTSCYGEIDSRLRNLRLDNFSYADLSDAFDGLQDTDEIFVDSFHFGDRGNEVVARRMSSILQRILE